MSEGCGGQPARVPATCVQTRTSEWSRRFGALFARNSRGPSKLRGLAGRRTPLRSSVMISRSKSKKKLVTGLIAATLGALAWTAPAEARPGWGGFHGGFRPMHAGFVHRPFVHRPFVHRAAFGHPAFFAGAGLGTTLALAPSFYASDCFVVRRAFVNPWGDIVTRRRLVCS